MSRGERSLPEFRVTGCERYNTIFVSGSTILPCSVYICIRVGWSFDFFGISWLPLCWKTGGMSFCRIKKNTFRRFPRPVTSQILFILSQWTVSNIRVVLQNKGMYPNFIYTWGIYTVDNAHCYLLEIKFISLIIIFISTFLIATFFCCNSGIIVYAAPQTVTKIASCLHSLWSIDATPLSAMLFTTWNSFTILSPCLNASCCSQVAGS